jgi:hypothetical protein
MGIGWVFISSKQEQSFGKIRNYTKFIENIRKFRQGELKLIAYFLNMADILKRDCQRQQK